VGIRGKHITASDWSRLAGTSGGHLGQPSAQAGPPRAVAQDHVQMAFHYLQGWRLHTLPVQPLPVLDNPCSQMVLTCVQKKFPVFQFVPIALYCITGHHWKESGALIFILSCQIFIHIDKIPPEPYHLQAEQSQLSQTLLVWGPLIILVAFCWSQSIMSISLLYWELRTRNSTPGVTLPMLSRGEGSAPSMVLPVPTPATGKSWLKVLTLQQTAPW